MPNRSTTWACRWSGGRSRPSTRLATRSRPLARARRRPRISRNASPRCPRRGASRRPTRMQPPGARPPHEGGAGGEPIAWPPCRSSCATIGTETGWPSGRSGRKPGSRASATTTGASTDSRSQDRASSPPGDRRGGSCRLGGRCVGWPARLALSRGHREGPSAQGHRVTARSARGAAPAGDRLSDREPLHLRRR